MEIAVVIPFLLIYLAIRYYTSDHETSAEKDIRHFQEGITLFQNARFDEAYRYFSEILAVNPKSATAYYYKGKTCLALGNTHSALYNFDQALSFDSSQTGCYIEKARLLLAEKEYRSAFKEFDKAVWFSHGKDPSILRERGLARLSVRLYRQASEDFARAVELGDEESCNILMQPPFFGRPLRNVSKA